MNVDEMGHQPYADANDITCFVPAEHEGNEVRYPVSRVGKRITLIACICADGSYLRPALVIPRKTFDDDLLMHGYSPEKVEIYDQAKGYIDQVIFDDWVKDTLVPEIERRRAATGYQGQAILILDNCSAHKGPVFAQMCNLHKITPIFLPPHASHLLQMLDLCLFGVTKRIISRMNDRDFHYLQTTHIVKILDSFMAACTPSNIIASFRLGGLSLFLDDPTGSRILRCCVTVETARRVLYVFKDDKLRFNMEDLGEEEDEEDFTPDETEEDEENTRAIVEEIKRLAVAA
jgi:hypothetical protein